jgi:Ca-activated chloride channel family protein
MKLAGFLAPMVISAYMFATAVICGDQQQSVPLFRSDVRLIEVYVTVLDSKGKYVSGLTEDRFEIFDDGAPCPIFSFEPVANGLSCAILLDRTGSMLAAMSAMKNALLRFIDAFRENDQFAIYSFNTSLRTIQGFTRDKNAAKQTVLRTIAQGATALFDSLSEVIDQLSRQKGKKVIVVSTDGDDNSSYLHSSAVVRKAKNAGIPVYALAQGDALMKASLIKTLKDVSRATGGFAYEVKKSSSAEKVFQEISMNLQHAYMISYVPPDANEVRWRSIRVNVKDLKNPRICAREGYYSR